MPKEMSAGERLTLKLGHRHKRMLESVLKLDGSSSAVAWIRQRIEEAYRPHAWGYFIRSLHEGKQPVMPQKRTLELKLERLDQAEVVVSVPARKRAYFQERLDAMQRKACALLGTVRLTLWVRDVSAQPQPLPESLVSLHERLHALERQVRAIGKKG